MKKHLPVIIVLAFLMAACKPSVSAVQTAMAKTQSAEEAIIKRVVGYWNGSVQVTYTQSDRVLDHIASVNIHENCQGAYICLENLTVWGKDGRGHEMQYIPDNGVDNQICFKSADREYLVCVSPLDDGKLEYSFEGTNFKSAGILNKDSGAITPQPPLAIDPPVVFIINDWNARIFRESDQQKTHPAFVLFKIIRNCPNLVGHCLYLIPLNHEDGLVFEIYPLRTVTYNQYCFGDGIDSFCFTIFDEDKIIFNCKKVGWIGNGEINVATTEIVGRPMPPEDPGCSGILTSQLVRGEYAYIVPGLETNNLRNTPGINGSVEGKIQPGAVIQIMDGPICANSYTWWKVLVLDTNNIGWTVENNAEEYFMLPCQSASCEQVVQDQPGSDACDPVGFLQHYFDIIAKGNLKRSYSLLSDRFVKKHHPDGYQPYLNWWSTVEKIEILSVNVTSTSDKRAVLLTELRYYFRNGQIDEYDLTEFAIAWDSPDGTCMMDDEVLIRGYR